MWGSPLDLCADLSAIRNRALSSTPPQTRAAPCNTRSLDQSSTGNRLADRVSTLRTSTTNAKTKQIWAKQYPFQSSSYVILVTQPTRRVEYHSTSTTCRERRTKETGRCPVSCKGSVVGCGIDWQQETRGLFFPPVKDTKPEVEIPQPPNQKISTAFSMVWVRKCPVCWNTLAKKHLSEILQCLCGWRWGP